MASKKIESEDKDKKEKPKNKKRKYRIRINFHENRTLFGQLAALIVIAICIITLTVHAITLTRYTVTFNSDGGTSVDNQKVIGNYKVDKPDVPRKTGHTFDGWFLNGEPFDFNKVITSDITLEARWTRAEQQITLNHTELFLSVGTNEQITVNGMTDSDYPINWQSSDIKVATVDSSGLVRALGAGTATITVSNATGTKTATANITVIK